MVKQNLKIAAGKARKAKRAILVMKRNSVKKASKVLMEKIGGIRPQYQSLRRSSAPVRGKQMGLIKKFAAVALIFGLFLQAGGFFIPTTWAAFNDTETSTQNSFSAASLDINLSPAGVYSSGLMYPTDATSTTFTLSNSGSLDYNYFSKIELLGSNKLPCDYVSVTATSTTGSGTSTFASLIKDFTVPTSTPIGNVNWQFNFTVATDTPPAVWGKTCFFKWVYNAWQTNLADDTNGFSDTEEKSGAIKIGKAVVLNEFIPNPTGSDTALKPGGEWVELYNNSNIPFDLSSWVIYDNDDSHELYITAGNTDTGTTTIMAHSWLVVYRNGDSDFNLNNDADSVRLSTGYPLSSHTLVDAYSYTEEKPEGFSYARIPDGIGSWVDPIPTPGKPNTVTDADGMNQDNYVGIPDPQSVVVEEEILATGTPESELGNLSDTSATVLGEQILDPATGTPPIISTTTTEVLVNPDPNSETVNASSTPEDLSVNPSNEQSDNSAAKDKEILAPAILPTPEQVPAVEPEAVQSPEPEPESSGKQNISEPQPEAVKSESQQSNIEPQSLAPLTTEPPAPALPEPSTGGTNE